MIRRIFWLLKANLSFYWRHPWQTLFLLTGLISGVALWSAVQIINQHAEASYQEANQLLELDAKFWIQPKGSSRLTQADYIQLRRAGFRQIYPIIEAKVSTSEAVPLDIIATDFLAFPDTERSNSLLEFSASWPEIIRPPFRAWYSADLADELGLIKGNRLQLRDDRFLPPAIIQGRSRQGRKILMDVSAAFELLNRNDFSYLVVGQLSFEKQQALTDFLPNHLTLVENNQAIDLTSLTGSLHTHLNAMSLLSFAVGFFIVLNAVRFSMWYRRPTLMACVLMGCRLRLLLTAIGIESLLLSFIGSFSGFFIGLWIGELLLPGLGASLQSLFSANLESTISWQFITLFKAWMMTVAGLLVALTLPMMLLMKRHPLEDGQISAVLKADNRVRNNLAMASVLLSILAIMFYPYVNSAISGFVLLGMVLFAAAWLLPMFFSALLTILQRWFSKQFMVRWMYAEARQQLPLLRTAMMALMLALTANLGVGTLVDSFRSAFTDWLSVRQIADIYLRKDGIDYEKLSDPDYSGEWLVDSHYRTGIQTRWEGRPVLLRGIDLSAPDTQQLPIAKWQADSAIESLDRWSKDTRTVLANEQVHYLAGVELNDWIELPVESGKEKFQVVGFFYDYGNPYYQFYLSSNVLAEFWPEHQSKGIALWLIKSDDRDSVFQKAIASMQALGALPGDWIKQSEIRALSVGIFDRTFAITASMNLLTLLIALIALLATLLSLLQSRMGQFAQWRALGLRQGEQLIIMSFPLVLFALLSWIVAIPLGALLSWILINRINIVSFGWSMPMQWEFQPALQLAGYLGLILIALMGLMAWQWRRKISTALAKLSETC
jgi:putative ABC transport system permease protein